MSGLLAAVASLFAGSQVQRAQLWPTGLVASKHGPTHVPCISRQILNHWSTSKVQFAIS